MHNILGIEEHGFITGLLMVGGRARSAFNKPATIDPRNYGQMIFFNTLIPGSTLVGSVQADHWAIARFVEETTLKREEQARHNS